MNQGAYQPFVPARRPGGKPDEKPLYRVLVHRKFRNHWNEMIERVGLQQAKQFWDHVSATPGQPSPLASITILKGKAGLPMADGWSRTHHYEVSGAGRVDYQYNNAYSNATGSDSHHVVAILTINYSSH
ncbi:hypothetical protein [Desertivibrio insolitus]|uniref:hypothetical protein n=1 Tax=Herbiconiux sp. SYSU D00978 TaxID=2812562 RepID=UPI001A972A3D|nr:hypothetical protein [Herbiconiux sp. SYSU D00978]